MLRALIVVPDTRRIRTRCQLIDLAIHFRNSELLVSGQNKKTKKQPRVGAGGAKTI